MDPAQVPPGLRDLAFERQQLTQQLNARAQYDPAGLAQLAAMCFQMQDLFHAGRLWLFSDATEAARATDAADSASATDAPGAAGADNAGAAGADDAGAAGADNAQSAPIERVVDYFAARCGRRPRAMLSQIPLYVLSADVAGYPAVVRDRLARIGLSETDLRQRLEGIKPTPASAKSAILPAMLGIYIAACLVLGILGSFWLACRAAAKLF